LVEDPDEVVRSKAMSILARAASEELAGSIPFVRQPEIASLVGWLIEPEEWHTGEQVVAQLARIQPLGSPFTVIHDALERLREVVERSRPLGSSTTSTGTILVEHVPHVGPEAWFHVIFPGLAETEIAELEQSTGRKFPSDYVEFLKQMNGVSLFSGALAMYGRRTSFARSGEAAWQPFSLVTPNTRERPPALPASVVIVGGYKADGSLLGIDVLTNYVGRFDRDSGKRLNRWANLSAMLTQEIERLAPMFDDRGRRADLKVPTNPPAERA
jgi:SMI1-KNR4 cell-wall